MRVVFFLAILLTWSIGYADDSDPEEPTVAQPEAADEAPQPAPPSPTDAPPATEDVSEPEDEKAWQPTALTRPRVRYPSEAKDAGIEGTVRLRLFLEVDGRFVKRKDPECRWSSLTPEERREASFHGRWCIEAISGPEELAAATLDAYATARYEPFTTKDGTPARRFFDIKAAFVLK